MTKRTGGKVGFPFIPVPETLQRGWYALKHILGPCIPDRIHRLGGGGTVSFAGDWRVDLCRQMSIGGRHRSVWCQAFQEAEAAGLITVGQSTLTVHSLDTHSTLTDTSLDTHLGSSARNDSGPISQIRREEIREDHTSCEDARARDTQGSAAIGFRWLEKLTGAQNPPARSFQADYAFIGSRPEAERVLVATHAKLTEYFREEPGLMRQPAHFVKYWASFVDGPRNRKPFANVTKLKGPAPVASEADYAADAAGGSPW